MAISQVLDTNVVLYHLGGRLSSPVGEGRNCVSIVTQLELLSYPNITPTEEAQIQSLLDDLTVVGLEPDICHSTVYLRRAYRLRLPDAIICATALALDATLLTNDKKLAEVSEIRVSSVSLRSDTP